MQKIIGILLCVALVFSVAACQAPGEAANPETPDATIPPTSANNTHDAPLHTFYAISVPAQVEYLYADDGTVLLEYAYQHVQLHISDQNVADQITLDFLSRVDSTRANAAAIAQQASENYNSSDSWTPYKYQTYYSPTRVDQGIISLFGTRTSYTGGKHPDQGCLSVTYDAANGDALTLGSILNHVDNKADLCNLLLDELAKVYYQYSLFDGYEDVIKERFMADESTDEAFYFTNTGLCFYFAPYEIAPFSSGIISVEIPYSKLPGILNDAYFPDESQPSTGTLVAENAEDGNNNVYSQLIESAIDPHGERILFYSDKTVRNLTITRGSWTPDGLYFLPEYTVFSATGVSNDKGIIVRMSISEMLPALMISYDTAVGTKNFYISQSKENGNILLLPVE